MDFQGPTRVRPRVYSLGTSHARWALLARPLINFIFVAPLTGICGILVVNQEDHVPYFTASLFFSVVVAAVYLWEVLAAVPVVCKMRPGLKQMPAEHDSRLSVSVTVRGTNMMLPALVRLVCVRFVQAVGLVMAFAGAAAFDISPDRQLTVEGILGLSVIVYLSSFGTLVYPYVRRAVRGLCCRPRTSSGVIRLVQFNVNGCVGTDGMFNPARVAEVIRRTGADIIALQNVGRHCRLTPKGTPLSAERSSVDQVQVLAELTGLHATFCSKTSGYGGEWGNAILSRWPALETSRLRLMGWKHHGSNRLAGPVPQIALGARFRPSGFQQDLWVVSTQFGWDFSGQEQLEEMREVMHWARSELLAPGSSPQGSSTLGIPRNIVFCGDFGAPTSCSSPALVFGEECGLVDAANLVSPQCCAPWGTYPDRPWMSFWSPDRILVTSDSSVKVLMCHPHSGGNSSTHRPLVTIVAESRM